MFFERGEEDEMRFCFINSNKYFQVILDKTEAGTAYHWLLTCRDEKGVYADTKDGHAIFVFERSVFNLAERLLTGLRPASDESANHLIHYRNKLHSIFCNDNEMHYSHLRLVVDNDKIH